MKESVGIALCDNYEFKRVEHELFHIIEAASGIKHRVYPGSSVFIKANLARPDSPEKAITCHPAVVKAIVTYFQSKKCKVIIGDSPGAPHGFSKKTLDIVYEATGMKQVAYETGCELNYDVRIAKIKSSKMIHMKELTVFRAITEADFVISAAKLKTHAMMRYTGAVKNLFGVIPGRMKMQYHLEMSKYIHFAKTLVDICEYINPALSIMDGIVGMEGNGPSAGDCRNSKLLMASDSPYALDLVAAHIIGMKPTEIEVLKEAINRELIDKDVSKIPIVGTPLDKINIEPFRNSDLYSLNDNMIALPGFNPEKCTLCKQCIGSCPAKAIAAKEGRICLEAKKCIQCFCCQELCPNEAIYIKDDLNYRLGGMYGKETKCSH